MKTFTGSVVLRVSARVKSKRQFQRMCASALARITSEIVVASWNLDEIVYIPAVSKGQFLLHLCTVGNPDHCQYAPVTTPSWHVVKSLGAAREKCRAYLEDNADRIGGGNWGPQSGEVTDHVGAVVARFSYNLRCSSPTGEELPCTMDAPLVASRKPMKFTVWGPDGIPIQEKPFASRDAAQRGIEEFVNRFRAQGYYAGVESRLEITEIASRCSIEECPDE